MKSNKPIPPKLAQRFLTWFLRNDIAEEVQGDLDEQFYEIHEKTSLFRAKLNYWFQVINYLRPFAISKSTSTHLNHSAMFQNYFKISWRNLLKNKGYSFINIGGLGLGFGCSILIFLFVSHHLHFDNFHDNSDRIYRIVTEQHRDEVSYQTGVPPGFPSAFRTDYGYAEKVVKIATLGNQLVTIEDNKKLKEDIAFTEQDFFKIFNFPLLNSNNDVSLSEPNTAIITESKARKLFGNDNPINKIFQLEGKEFITITGVLKDLPKTTVIKADIFISYVTLKKYNGFLANDEEWRGINGSLQCFTLLHPNQNISQIENELFGYVKKFRPDSKNVHHYKLQPLADIHFNTNYRGGISSKVLWIFSLIGFFLLIVASINFINISTAQSGARSKEVGIRKVLGSIKSYLFWQFMVETFLITLLALLFGLVLSILVLPYFNTVFGLELSLEGLLNYTFFGFACLLLFGISILAGSYPGILLARITPVLALKGKLTQKGAGGLMTRKVLVITQFVISIVLIIGTIVINKQITYAINSDLGFDKSGIIRVALPSTLEPEKLIGLKGRISNFSGVEKITACYTSPGAGNNSWGTDIKYNNNPEAEDFSIKTKIGDKDYLNTFGLKLLAGRNFHERDSADEVIVNAMFAEKIGVQSPEELLGKPISLAGGSILNGTIVGVIADFHDQDFHENINPIFIAPVTNYYREFAIKINMNNTKAILGHIEKQWADFFPSFIFEYDFLDDRVAQLYKSEQQFLSLTKLFSALAIFIGCLGIYGLILFFVVQKTKEIGIRKVLGGNVLHILILVTQDFFKLVVIAGVIATPLAWYFMNEWLQNYVYKTALSWWIFALAIGIVMGITLLTICYQAIKAANANPVDSLRSE